MFLYSYMFLRSAMNYICEYVYNCLLPLNNTALIVKRVKQVMTFRMAVLGNLQILHKMQQF